jgi:hypothetical protein
MSVKTFLRRLMKQTKTLNVREEVHAKVKVAAAQERVKVSDYAEAAIEVGLKKPREIMRLLAERTSRESEQESSK